MDEVTAYLVGNRDTAFEKLRAENEKLRTALRQFVATCDTAPPISLITEIGLACDAARKALETK